jgi:hypothetical protein
MARREHGLTFNGEFALLPLFAKAVDISQMIPAEKLTGIDAAKEAVKGAYRVGSALGGQACGPGRRRGYACWNVTGRDPARGSAMPSLQSPDLGAVCDAIVGWRIQGFARFCRLSHVVDNNR